MVWQWVNESRRLIGVYRASSPEEGELDLNETNIKWMTPNGLKPLDFNAGDLNFTAYVYKIRIIRRIYLFFCGWMLFKFNTDFNPWLLSPCFLILPPRIQLKKINKCIRICCQ